MSAAARPVRAPSPRGVLLLATALVVGVLLYLGREALTPFLIGLLLIYLLDPAVRWVARRGVPRSLAVLIVYAVVLVALVQGLSLLLRPLVQQIGAFVADLPRFMQAVDEQLRRVSEVYQGLDLPAPVRAAVDRALGEASAAAGGFDPSGLLPIARTIAGTLSSAFGFLIIPVWAFYILKDRDALVTAVDRSLPDAWREDTWAVLRIVERVFGRWLRGQLLLGLVVGAATFLGLLLLGFVVDGRFIQFAVLLAVIAGLLELLPIIGPIIAMVPALLVALTVSPQAVLAVLLLYLAVQQVENNVLVPKIQGDAIELHPSVVIFALVLGGAIAGLLGAIIALPITAAGRDVYRYLFRRLDPAAAPGPEEAVAQVRPSAAGTLPGGADAASAGDGANPTAAGAAEEPRGVGDGGEPAQPGPGDAKQAGGRPVDQPVQVSGDAGTG